MSYESQASLRGDALFTNRVVSALNEQAMVYKADARPQWVALAEAQLRGTGPLPTWLAVITEAPGIKDATDGADVTDGELLSAIQAQWGTVAELTYPNPSSA